jgi:cobalt-precorrin 5A hydrolase
MYPKGILIVSVTGQGVGTAQKIQAALTAHQIASKVYAPQKYLRPNVVAMDKTVEEFLRENFGRVDGVVAVMATGIVIRAVAPCLQGKLVDPAVVGVDAVGKFVISLLSGHYGGANHLARLIADALGATAVKTTASDALCKEGVDELARNFHLAIINPESITAVNAALVEGKQLALILVDNTKMVLTEAQGYSIHKTETFEEAIKLANTYDAAAIVTANRVVTGKTAKPITILKPKKIAVGVGARKIISPENIIQAIHVALAKVDLTVERVDGLASVDIKQDSPGFAEAAVRLGLPFEFYSVAALSAVESGELSVDSEFVKEKIGIGGVCERAALKQAGKNPHLLLKKQKLNGVTVAIAEGE